MIDQTLIKGTESKKYLDKVMQAKSEFGVILKKEDQIFDEIRSEKQYQFRYLSFGLIYEPYVKNPDNFTFWIRFEYESEDLKMMKWMKVDSNSVYKGLLIIGNQFLNSESSLERILKNPAFSFIKKGEITAGKRIMPYALVSFENILIKLLFNPINGHLKLVELLK